MKVVRRSSVVTADNLPAQREKQHKQQQQKYGSTRKFIGSDEETNDDERSSSDLSISDQEDCNGNKSNSKSNNMNNGTKSRSFSIIASKSTDSSNHHLPNNTQRQSSAQAIINMRSHDKNRHQINKPTNSLSTSSFVEDTFESSNNRSKIQSVLSPQRSSISAAPIAQLQHVGTDDSNISHNVQRSKQHPQQEVRLSRAQQQNSSAVATGAHNLHQQQSQRRSAGTVVPTSNSVANPPPAMASTTPTVKAFKHLSAKAKATIKVLEFQVVMENAYLPCMHSVHMLESFKKLLMCRVDAHGESELLAEVLSYHEHCKIHWESWKNNHIDNVKKDFRTAALKAMLLTILSDECGGVGDDEDEQEDGERVPFRYRTKAFQDARSQEDEALNDADFMFIICPTIVTSKEYSKAAAAAQVDGINISLSYNEYMAEIGRLHTVFDQEDCLETIIDLLLPCLAQQAYTWLNKDTSFGAQCFTHMQALCCLSPAGVVYLLSQLESRTDIRKHRAHSDRTRVAPSTFKKLYDRLLDDERAHELFGDTQEDGSAVWVKDAKRVADQLTLSYGGKSNKANALNDGRSSRPKTKQEWIQVKLNQVAKEQRAAKRVRVQGGASSSHHHMAGGESHDD